MRKIQLIRFCYDILTKEKCITRESNVLHCNANAIGTITMRKTFGRPCVTVTHGKRSRWNLTIAYTLRNSHTSSNINNMLHVYTLKLYIEMAGGGFTH
jgi:hypothetical protein